MRSSLEARVTWGRERRRRIAFGSLAKHHKARRRFRSRISTALRSPTRPRAAELVRRWLAVLVVITAAAPACVNIDVQGDPQLADIGFSGPSFEPSAAASGDKPQSKLWFNDGSWWSVIYMAEVQAIVLAELDSGSQQWRATPNVVDERVDARADVLWDGSQLHVMSAGGDPGRPEAGARYQRFSYDPSAREYELLDGFPVAVNSHGSETIVIAKDSRDAMWMTYTHNRTVWVSTSSVDGKSWVRPFALPVDAAARLSSDDIATVLSFNDRRRGPSVGVFFSDQVTGTYTFAMRTDGSPPDEWRADTVLQGDGLADDHLNFKAAEIDGESWIVGAVKTSLNSPQDPLTMILVRDPNGDWTSTTFGRVIDQHTRPIVLIDGEHRQIHVFASSPCCSGGLIYHKSTSLDSPQFDVGLGEVFIALQGASSLNNPTSAKHPVNGETGMLVLAADVDTGIYAHNYGSLRSEDIALDTLIPVRPRAVTTSSEVSVRFVSTSVTARFQCRVDGQPYELCRSPLTLDGSAIGPHEFWVRSVDNQHPDVIDTTPARVTWRRVERLFLDDFEAGLGGWDVTTSETSAATVISDPSGERGSVAAFASDGTARNAVHATKAFEPKRQVVVNVGVRVDEGATDGAHVRLLTITDEAARPVLYLYRQSGTRDDGRIWIRAGELRWRSSAVLELGTWADLSVEVMIEPSGRAIVDVWRNDEKIVTALAVNLETPVVSGLQIGYPTAGQRYQMLVDDVEVLS